MSREMKDSGVEWIGEIPRDWEVGKYKNYCHVFAGGTPNTNNKSFYDGDIPWIQSGKIQNCVINDCSRYITKEGFENSATKMIPKNTAVLAMTGATCGNVGYTNIDLCANQSVMAFVSNQNINDKYIFYSLLIQNDAIKINQNGSAQSGINVENGKNMIFPTPPLLEQQNISDFLDEKVGEIDRLIDNAKKSIEEYKKYKQSVITETVTKGLDSNVEMKDSGIEWIGEIPKDWNISNIGRMCFVTKLAGFEYTKDMVNNISYNGEVPIVRAQNIKMGRFINNINEYISTDLSKELDRSALNKKCLIMTFIGAGIGEVAIFNKKSRYHLAPNVAKIVINNNMNKFILEEFLLYFIMSFSGQEEINKIKKSTAQPSLSMETIRSIKIIVTKTLKEQKDIVSYLDSKCAEIDNLISKKERLISELESYKKSLIYEYVTGKKEVL